MALFANANAPKGKKFTADDFLGGAKHEQTMEEALAIFDAVSSN